MESVKTLSARLFFVCLFKIGEVKLCACADEKNPGEQDKLLIITRANG